MKTLVEIFKIVFCGTAVLLCMVFLFYYSCKEAPTNHDVLNGIFFGVLLLYFDNKMDKKR